MKTLKFYEIKNQTKEKNNHRTLESSSFYNSYTWRKLRRLKLQINPICESKNCNSDAFFVDHILPIKMGGEKLDFDNLQSLCKPCNFSKTAKQKGQDLG